MTDTYGVGGGSRNTREPFRGRYRVSSRTGERQVWNGTQYVPETAAALAPDAAEVLSRERAELNDLTEASSLGEQFLELNQDQKTGSLIRHIPLLNDLGRALSPRLQQMENIQNARVFGYMRGGAAGGGLSPQVANTPQEQGRIERTGPTIQNTGPVNRAVVLRTQIDRDLQTERLNELEQWVRDPRRRSVEGFEQWWAREAPRRRAAIQRRYEQTNGSIAEQAAGRPATTAAEPPPQGVDPSDWEYLTPAERALFR